MAGHSLPDAAIKTAIKAAIDAKSLGITVYKEQVPEGTGLPYIQLTKSASTLFSNKQTWGNEDIWVVHVFHAAIATTDSTLSTINVALTEAALTVAGYNVVLCIMDSGNTFWDTDGECYHGVLSYRIVTTGAARR